MIVISERFDKDNEAWEVWTRAWSYGSSRRPNGPSRHPHRGNEQSPLYISSSLMSLRRQVKSPVRESTPCFASPKESLLRKPEDSYKSPVKSQCRYAGDTRKPTIKPSWRTYCHDKCNWNNTALYPANHYDWLFLCHKWPNHISPLMGRPKMDKHQKCLPIQKGHLPTKAMDCKSATTHL